MRRLFGALALSGTIFGSAVAQPQPQVPSFGAPEATWRFHASVGLFAPILPVVAVDNGRDASVELESSAVFAGALSYRLGSSISIYGSVLHFRSRMNHSSALVLQGPARDESAVNLFTPTAGFLIERQVIGNVRQFVRIGAGVKFYEFNLLEVPDGVQDPAGDLGLGVIGGDGPVMFTAEARWMPSQFDPAFLPVRTIDDQKQLQNDWSFLIGFQFEL